MLALRRLVPIALIACAVGACAHAEDDWTDSPAASTDGGPERVSAAEVRARMKLVIGGVVESSPKTVNTFTDSPVWKALIGAFSKVLQAFSSVPSLVPPGMAGLPGGDIGICTGDGGCAPSPTELLQQIEQLLEVHFFPDRNLESSDATAAVFLLQGTPMCRALAGCKVADCTASDPACAKPECAHPDAACVHNIDGAELRIEAKLVGADGLDIRVMVGPARAAPIKLELRHGQVAIEFDLGNAKAAIDHLQAVTGTGTAQVASAAGRTRFEATVNGNQDLTVQFSILEALEFQLSLKEGPLALKIDTATPLVAVRTQGLLGELSVAVNAGAIDFSVPYAALTPQGTGSGKLALHIDGLSWRTKLGPNQDWLTLENIGLGARPTMLSKDGDPIIALDLNAKTGRVFDLSLTPHPATNGVLFGVTPGFDVRASFNLQRINGDFPQIASFLLNNSYEVSLLGDSGGQVLPISKNGVDWDGGIKVVTGSLTLSSSASSEPFVVEAGQCLNSAEVSSDRSATTPTTPTTPQTASYVVSDCP